MKSFLGTAIVLTAAAALAGCAGSCIPGGWYASHATSGIKDPPSVAGLAHSKQYEIPGGSPAGKPPRGEVCKVQPPKLLNKKSGAKKSK